MTIQSTMTGGPAPKRSLVGPALLIGIGVVLFLNTVGWLGWEVWDTILRLWPVLLLAAGLNLVVGRRSRMISAVLAATLVIVVGAAIVSDGTWRRSGTGVTTETVIRPRGRTQRAELEIAVGAGILHLDALSNSNNLVDGTVERWAREPVTQNFRLVGDTAYYTLRSDDTARITSPFSPRRDQPLVWDLSINPTISVALDVSTGAGDAMLDLSDMRATDVRLHIGVGKTQLTLPARGHVEAEVYGGIGTTTIIIPAGMAARIETSAGLGTVTVQGNYERNDRLYVSPAYTTADHRLNLHVSSGIGNITIRQAANE